TAMMPPMRNWLSWVIWTALVVAGIVSSFQIWLRAFDVGNGIPSGAPKSVPPTHRRQVPAIIRRWTTPPRAHTAPGATAPTSERRKTTPPAAVAPSSPAQAGASVVAAGPAVVAPVAAPAPGPKNVVPLHTPKPKPKKVAPAPPPPAPVLVPPAAPPPLGP